MSQLMEQQEQQTDTQAEQPPERKSRFAVSREAHEEYVTGVATIMTAITEKVRSGDKPLSVSPPFCPTTGFAYGGASMTRLMLESVDKGYKDDRWLTFKQLQNYKFESKNFKVKVKKGEHGVKLLRSEDVAFVVHKDGKWEFLDDKRAMELWREGVEVQRKTLFYPYTVFNASQLEGFPPKEAPAPAMTEKERNAAIDRFVACLGVKVEHGHSQASYDAEKDTIKLPDPATYKNPDEYYAMKLRLAFHSTGHNDRERRSPDIFEVMRGETFSLLAGSRLGLPMPVDGGAWPAKFEGVGKWKALEASADASKMLVVLDQFCRGEEPKAVWFPKKEEWPAMIAAQESVSSKPEAAPSKRMRA